MKYVKMLSLLAVAATALMALSATASATVLTKSSTGTQMVVGETITAVSEGGHVRLTGPLGIAVECTGHVAGQITNAGSSTTTVKGNITALSFTACTNGYVVDVETKGTLEVHTEGASNNSNGTVTSSGAKIRVTNVPILGECGYETSNTDIGQLTGSTTKGGSTATFDIAAEIPRTFGSAFCGSTGTWEGSYSVTSPDFLNVD